MRRLLAVQTWAMPVAVGMVVLYAAYVRLALGRWPVYGYDRPEGPFMNLTGLGILLLGLTYMVTVGWFLPAATLMFTEHRRVVFRRAAIFVPFSAAWWWMVRADPWGFLGWWFD